MKNMIDDEFACYLTNIESYSNSGQYQHSSTGLFYKNDS